MFGDMPNDIAAFEWVRDGGGRGGHGVSRALDLRLRVATDVTGTNDDDEGVAAFLPRSEPWDERSGRDPAIDSRCTEGQGRTGLDARKQEQMSRRRIPATSTAEPGNTGHAGAGS